MLLTNQTFAEEIIEKYSFRESYYFDSDLLVFYKENVKSQMKAPSAYYTELALKVLLWFRNYQESGQHLSLNWNLLNQVVLKQAGMISAKVERILAPVLKERSIRESVKSSYDSHEVRSAERPDREQAKKWAGSSRMTDRQEEKQKKRIEAGPQKKISVVSEIMRQQKERRQQLFSDSGMTWKRREELWELFSDSGMTQKRREELWELFSEGGMPQKQREELQELFVNGGVTQKQKEELQRLFVNGGMTQKQREELQELFTDGGMTQKQGEELQELFTDGRMTYEQRERLKELLTDGWITQKQREKLREIFTDGGMTHERREQLWKFLTESRTIQVQKGRLWEILISNGMMREQREELQEFLEGNGAAQAQAEQWKNALHGKGMIQLPGEGLPDFAGGVQARKLYGEQLFEFLNRMQITQAQREWVRELWDRPLKELGQKTAVSMVLRKARKRTDFFLHIKGDSFVEDAIEKLAADRKRFGSKRICLLNGIGITGFKLRMLHRLEETITGKRTGECLNHLTPEESREVWKGLWEVLDMMAYRDGRADNSISRIFRKYETLILRDRERQEGENIRYSVRETEERMQAFIGLLETPRVLTALERRLEESRRAEREQRDREIITEVRNVFGNDAAQKLEGYFASKENAARGGVAYQASRRMEETVDAILDSYYRVNRLEGLAVSMGTESEVYLQNRVRERVHTPGTENVRILRRNLDAVTMLIRRNYRFSQERGEAAARLQQRIAAGAAIRLQIRTPVEEENRLRRQDAVGEESRLERQTAAEEGIHLGRQTAMETEKRLRRQAVAGTEEYLQRQAAAGKGSRLLRREKPVQEEGKSYPDMWGKFYAVQRTAPGKQEEPFQEPGMWEETRTEFLQKQKVQESYLDETRQAVSVLRKKVDVQEKLMAELRQKTAGEKETSQIDINVLTKKVMKKMEDELRLEKMRRGLL